MKTPASTKAGRNAIAAQFRQIGLKFGAVITEREESPGYASGAGLSMQFSLGGVGAQLGISDLHERHGGEFAGGLISWYNDQPPGEWHERRARYFTPGFNSAVGQNNTARPHHKATSCDTWEMLAARLQAGLRKASTGAAYLPDSEEESI